MASRLTISPEVFNVALTVGVGVVVRVGVGVLVCVGVTDGEGGGSASR